jgi:hypothetical protein
MADEHKEFITDKQFEEIKRSLKSYVNCYGIEGTEDYIKEIHKDNPVLQKTMLFVLRDKYNIKNKGKKFTNKQIKIFQRIREIWDKITGRRKYG